VDLLLLLLLFVLSRLQSMLPQLLEFGGLSSRMTESQLFLSGANKHVHASL